MTENLEQSEYLKFNRDSIKARIKFKKEKGLPLVVHIFVPLCDNEHQGIVSVSKSLGDGMNLKTNLYWGAGYGIKTHFKRRANWKLVSAQKDIDSNIPDRKIPLYSIDCYTLVRKKGLL